MIQFVLRWMPSRNEGMLRMWIIYTENDCVFPVFEGSLMTIFRELIRRTVKLLFQFFPINSRRRLEK